MRYKKVSAIIVLCISLYMAAGRCQEEMLIAQDEGRFYHSIATATERFISQVAPLPGVIPASRLSNAGTLSNAEACIAVHSTILVIVGYLLPMTYLLVEELLSRNRFECAATGRITFLPRKYTLLAFHMALVLFEAILSFQFIVAVLNLVNISRHY